MEDWALKGMQRWPNVPALFGWLGLDRRGRWLIRGELITRPQIVETIGRNYAADDQGRWYFQNGPQRGYVVLAGAPLILRATDIGDGLIAHTGQRVARVTQAFLDEQGALLFATDLGPGLLLDGDLGWALERLRRNGEAIDESDLERALLLPSGTVTDLVFATNHGDVPLSRLDDADAPAHLGFVREPRPDQASGDGATEAART